MVLTEVLWFREFWQLTFTFRAVGVGLSALRHAIICVIFCSQGTLTGFSELMLGGI